MTEVCHDVCIEPHLQPLTGEALGGASAISTDGARLDVAAGGFWGSRHERAFFDIRVSSIRCIRGVRSSVGSAARQQLAPIDLVISEANISE